MKRERLNVSCAQGTQPQNHFSFFGEQATERIVGYLGMGNHRYLILLSSSIQHGRPAETRETSEKGTSATYRNQQNGNHNSGT